MSDEDDWASNILVGRVNPSLPTQDKKWESLHAKLLQLARATIRNIIFLAMLCSKAVDMKDCLGHVQYLD
jgi:hypothetical protein